MNCLLQAVGAAGLLSVLPWARTRVVANHRPLSPRRREPQSAHLRRHFAATDRTRHAPLCGDPEASLFCVDAASVTCPACSRGLNLDP